MHRALAALLPFAALCLAACSGGDSDDPAPAATPAALPAVPAGIPLPGDPDDDAFGAVAEMEPSPAPPSEIVDGLLTTRLEAAIAAGATVGEVNDALAANDAAIVSMLAGWPVVTLVVPPAADLAVAQARADALVATGAFAAASPCTTTAATQLGLQSAVLESTLGALQAMRMPAAKNAVDLVGIDAQFLPVIVADHYASDQPDPRIDAQVFDISIGGATDSGYLGNRGVAVAGLIGVDPSEAPTFVGVHPQPSGPLVIYSVLEGGLTYMERIGRLGALVPATNKTVLHTALAYPPVAEARSKAFRALDAALWRHRAGGAAQSFVHAVPAGDFATEPGDLATAAWMTPFALSDAFPDLTAALAGEDLVEFLAIADLLWPNEPVPPPLGNVRIVGSSSPSHEASYFSSVGEDLRAVGEAVTSPCVNPDALCVGGVGSEVGTFVASAQVAGLYAYLWNLKPSMSAAELLQTVDDAWFQSWQTGVVDAYHAVLALDPNLQFAAVRRELLDVAGSIDAYDESGNGAFDEHDLAVFLAAFDAETGTRFDLNGDGFVGGDFRTQFDLDVNSPPFFNTVFQFPQGVEHEYDELDVNDIEVLCYYASTGLYVGDEAARDELLAECHGEVPPPAITLDEFHLDGFAEAEIGAQLVVDVFDYADENVPDTAFAQVTTGGLMEASASQDGFTFVGDEGGLTGIQIGGTVEGRFDATVPKPFTAYAQSGLEITCDFEVTGSTGDATCTFTLTYEGTVTNGLHAYSDSEFAIVSSDTGFVHTFEKETDDTTGSFTEVDVAQLELPPGSYQVRISIECEFADSAEVVGVPVDSFQRLDWDLDLSLDQ